MYIQAWYAHHVRTTHMHLHKKDIQLEFTYPHTSALGENADKVRELISDVRISEVSLISDIDSYG